MKTIFYTSRSIAMHIEQYSIHVEQYYIDLHVEIATVYG